MYVCVQGRFKFLCVLGGSGTIIHVSADDSTFFFFCNGGSEGNPTVCFDVY